MKMHSCFALVMAVSLTACDILAPERYEQYELVAINGQNLPVASVVGASNSVPFTSGKLTLWGGDFFLDLERSFTTELDDGSANLMVKFPSSERGTYSAEGYAVELVVGTSGKRYSGIVDGNTAKIVKEVIADFDDKPDTLVFSRKR